MIIITITNFLRIHIAVFIRFFLLRLVRGRQLPTPLRAEKRPIPKTKPQLTQNQQNKQKKQKNETLQNLTSLNIDLTF